MTNFESAAFLFLCLSYIPLSVSPNSPALSFIPHKHMRYGAVLMRTEWTDPRPQHHWGPQQQIHRCFQFGGAPFKRPQCGIPNTWVLCSTIPSQILQKLPLCPFLRLHCWNADVLTFYFFTCPAWKFFKCFFVENLSWNCWQSDGLVSDCIMDRNTAIPFDVPSVLDVWDPSYILWLWAH